MEPQPVNTPLVVIVGETASGKSSLALQLAQRFNGEIIAADSRTVYKGMNIGTAKPTLAERASVRHHLLDITSPNRPISAAQFKQLANHAIQDIRSRNKLPILVGGTGLYINAVVYDYVFAPKSNEVQRSLFEDMSIEDLQQYLLSHKIALPTNYKNKRHLVRQAETGGTPRQILTLPPRTIIIGVSRDREEMRQRIALRVEEMLKTGLEDEVRTLVAKYGWEPRALQTIGYQEFRPYINGEISYPEVEARIVHNTLQYAKRQRTWFKRNKDIHWICNTEEAIALVTTLLNK